MLVDAISEETLERLEEEYFSDGLDELVPMLQDAHVLSEHWYLTKASYACQLLLARPRSSTATSSRRSASASAPRPRRRRSTSSR